MAQDWFKRAESFWIRIPVSVEGWATVFIAFAFWIICGMFLDVGNPNFINVLSFIVAGIFFYLLVVWIAHNTESSSNWRL